MTWFLIDSGIRLAVFGAVFTFAVYRIDDVDVEPRWFLPIVGGVFGALNIGVYWAAKPILELATLGQFGVLLPLVISLLFLYATASLLKQLKIAGLWAMCKLAALLTVAHGALWLVLDKIA